ncbi:hypothetical protein UGMREWDR_CDS0233 [Aeromonas phage GomatiRiver_11]|nr:hypothetical protein UGMREWDR_CDS0233 [Aeromonas phage GomatiRiver_11]
MTFYALQYLFYLVIFNTIQLDRDSQRESVNYIFYPLIYNNLLRTKG